MKKRFKLAKSSLTPNFIGSWEIETGICDKIIAYFDKHQEKQTQGATGNGTINLETKNRKDISLSPKELKFECNQIFNEYFHL